MKPGSKGYFGFNWNLPINVLKHGISKSSYKKLKKRLDKIVFELVDEFARVWLGKF